jgi:pantoate--beta-alanine ligase
MGIHTSRESLLPALLPFRPDNKIGFVPTMGALHQGHLSLVQKALDENNCVVVSVFVNPTQFDNDSDLEKYPRTLESDVKLLHQLKGNIFVFAPAASKLYEGPVVSGKYSFGYLEHEMEGKHRIGHFNGVATVVNLLLRTIKPNRAYFGEKDFQQLLIVKKLVTLEKLPVEVIGCPIVREANGLAMSSRNERLSPQQFSEAALIFKTISEVKEKFETHSIPQLNKMVSERFIANKFLRLEYFEIASSKSLKTARRKHKKNKYRAFIAVFAGEVRLIDNIALN